MSTSTLALALATFSEIEMAVIKTAKTDRFNYHVYYRKDGANRVMLVPKRCDKLEQLQSEIATLLGRSVEDQQAHGYKDGQK